MCITHTKFFPLLVQNNLQVFCSSKQFLVVKEPKGFSSSSQYPTIPSKVNLVHILTIFPCHLILAPSLSLLFLKTYYDILHDKTFLIQLHNFYHNHDFELVKINIKCISEYSDSLDSPTLFQKITLAVYFLRLSI
jgi:hypothetical protein